MRPLRRFPLGLALATAVLSASCGGCERRVEEPVPEVRPLATSAQTPGQTPGGPPGEARLAADTPATAKPWGSRCVRESPRAAKRSAPPSPDPRCPADPERPAPLRTGKVTFSPGDTIKVEVAEKDHDRQRGLMFRPRMAGDHGMIFVFEEKSNHSFWMHNTCIPLDMLYLDDDGLIVGIEENTPTMSDETFDVGCDSRYVLEVNAGWTRAHGVTAGQRVRIEGL
jgi:uncharacterized membrane protein (UPF0127 family)